jgi:uncharacterized repeat protein (TIGR03803 family)
MTTRMRLIMALLLMAPPAVAAPTFSTLYSFGNGTPTGPYFGALLVGQDGRLYGTACGNAGAGMLFALDLSGTIDVLHTFTEYPGSCPAGNLAQATDGTIYGTTYNGGPSNAGTLYRLAPDSLEFSILHVFEMSTQADGANPTGLVRGPDGAYYGVAADGGLYGGGTAFRFDPVTSTFSVLKQFGEEYGLGAPNSFSAAGFAPNGRLLLGNDGYLYGTTIEGPRVCDAADICTFRGGTVFRMDTTGAVTWVHDFMNYEYPYGGLIQASDGNFYGTTSGCCTGSTDGSVFRMDPAGNVTTLHTFDPGSLDGSYLVSELLEGSDGSLYGTASRDGMNGAGTLFRIDLQGSTFDVLQSFGVPGDGAVPRASVVEGPDGSLYSTTYQGGAYQGGTVFKWGPISHPPVSSDGTATVTAGASTQGTLTATDADGDSLTYSIVKNGSQGTAVITDAAGGTFMYTANVGSGGTDTFTFKANDGWRDSNIATVTVTIARPQTCASDVSATVSVASQGGLKLNKKTGRWTQSVTLKNGDGAVAGPVFLVLDQLTSGATLFNFNGTTSCTSPSGSPYINVDIGPDGLFNSRERATETLDFVALSSSITYKIRVLAGTGQR